MKKSQLLNFFRVTLLLLIFSAFTTSAWGAKLYLKPGVWNSDNPCYIAYFWGGSGDNQWATMTDCGDGYFSCDIPGSNRTNVKIQRKNPSSGCNHDWNGSWNDTGDQSMNGNDCLVVNDWGNFSWTSYSSSGGGSSTTTTEYYIAGWGGAWDPKAIKMPSDGSYTFPLQLASGDDCSYEFKITDGTWNKQWACGAVKSVSGVAKSCCGSNSGDNITFRLSKNADVTIKFDGTNITIDAVENTTVVTCDLVGSFSTDGWTTGGKEMKLNDEGSEYQITNVNLTAGTEVKVKYVDIMAGYSQLENPDIYVSKDDQYDNIVIKETGVYSFYYKISSNLIWLVQESSETSGDDEDNYMEASECDPTRTKIIFTEDFGEFSDIKDRLGTAYSKTGEDYTATVPSSSYDAITSSCTAIKDAGYYAVLANPYYAGCGTQTQGADACSCGGDQWYENITDHTGKTNGGMLFYNCKDGRRNTDILYECTVNVCENTFINFSAYIASATAQNRGCGVKAKVRFILYDAETNEELSRYTTDEISLSETEQSEKWKKIAVMFNSKTADKVTLKLLNLAGEGCGNDLLLDDITFSVCAPSAKLTCSNGTAESNILYGETETLTVALTEGMISGPYYYWQYRNNDKEAWKELHDDSQEPKPVSGTTASSLSIKHTSPTVNYRVIIVPTLNGEPVGLDNVLKNVADPVPCGMYAITNEVKVNVKALELNIRPEKLDICVNSRGKYELTITNPMSTAIEDVQVTFIAPPSMKTDDVTVTRSVGTYNNGIWEIESLPPGDSKLTYEAEATSSENILAKAYVSKIGEQITYSSYEDATLPEESKADGTINVAKVTVDVNPTSVVNKCEGNLVEFTAEATSTCDGDVKYQWVRRKIGTDVFSNITNEINSKYTISSLTEDDALYEYAVVVNIDNCPCVNKTSDVATIGMLEETDISNVELYEYKECATTGELYLYDLVDVSDKSGLIFYETETSTTSIDTEISKKNTGINNDYYFTYKEEGKCVSKRGKVHVTILPKPEANITSGGSQTFCAAENYTFSISAEAKNGTGIWSVTSGAASIDNVNSASTTAKVEAGKTATLTWTVSNEKCDATASTTLSVDEQPKVTLLDGKGSASICGKSEFTVGVSTTASSGTWSIVEGSASIKNANDKETLVTGVGAGKTVKLKYTATNGTCDPVDSELVVLTNLVCNQFVLENTFASETIGKGICLNGETTLTVTITNSSMATSTNVNTNVKLPAGLTYVSHSGSGTYNKDTGLWLIPSLEKGVDKKAQLVITVKGTTAATHKVTATITKATGTPVSGMSIPASITVHALPTAKFKESTSQVCINPKGTTEETQVEVEFTGTPDYTLKYKLGDSEYTTVPAVSSPHIILKGISADATITLISVKDNNGCENTIANQSHEVKAIFPADITITKPTEICAGDSLTLSAPTITANGSNVTDGKWYLGGEVYTRKSPVGNDKNNAILQYIANSSCGGDVESNEVTITVKSVPTITINSDGNLPADICAGQKYQLPSVTVTNNGSDVTSEGWYLGATKITLDEGEYSYIGGEMITLDKDKCYKFSVDDNGKSLVYKAVNDCGETFKEFRSELDVNDCSNFIFEYFSDTTVCKDAEVVLTAKITNNSNYDLSNVILSQSWSGEQIASKDANNNNKVKDIFVTSGDVASEYDEDNNLWKIETFTAHKSAILTITFSAQKSEYFSMYMTESNGVEYNNTNTDNSDDSPVIIDGDDKVELKVLEISGPVTLKPGKNYNGKCPTKDSQTILLSSLVEYNSTDDLYYYDKDKNLLTKEPTFDAKDQKSETYYIKREESGKCISDKYTEITINIYEKPSVSVLPKDPTINCTSPTATITASGASTYTWKDDNDNTISSTSTDGSSILAEKKGATTTYTVVGTSEHGCDSDPVSVTVDENFTTPTLNTKNYVIDSNTGNEVSTTTLTCTNTEITLFVESTNSTATKNVSYNWYLDKLPEVGESVTPIQTGTTYPVTTEGNYVVQAVGGNGCTNDYVFTITEDNDNPIVSINSKDTITCDEPSIILTASSTVSNYKWYNESGVEIGDGATYTATTEGKYKVVATADNGCTGTDTKLIEERTTLPIVTINSNENKVTCKPNTLTASGAITYVWSTSEINKSIEVTSGGSYTVIGKNRYGCEATGTIVLTEDKQAPSISLTADDTSLTCTKETAVLTAEVTNADASRNYSYKWEKNGVSVSETSNQLDANTQATYKVTITDETNACTNSETINIKENKNYPKVETKPLDAVCLPATVDIKTAVVSTNADEVKYYADAALTQELTDTNVEATANAIYYVVGYEIQNNGCVGEAVEIPLSVKPVSKTPVVNNYDECAVVGTKTLSSLVVSDTTSLVFFADETSTQPIANLFDTSLENTTTSYWVTNTEVNACESERVEFQVNIYGYIDFSVAASDTRLPAGRDVTITVTPLTDTPVDEYVWYRGEEVIQSTAELELTEQLYLSEKYSVQAIGRCNSPKKEVEVEAVWPTAFTPHNGNGKNDDFAKGMHIIVFNRFYTKIFEGPDGWDGSINGTMNESESIAVPGVYYYSVQLPNGEVKKGTIEIVR